MEKKDVKMNQIIIAMGAIVIALGVKMIYDARPIVKEYFSFGSENEAVLGMKILGFLLTILGAVLLYFNF